MRTIVLKEFKKNLDYYIDLAKREEIQVTRQGTVIFTMIPRRIESLKELEHLLGCLPAGTKVGEDPSEREN